MTNSSAQPLYDAVARRSGLVLSLPSPAGLVNRKSHFVGDDESGVWVEAVGEWPLVEKLISGRMPVGVSFRGGDARHVFVAPMVRRDPAYPLRDGSGASCPALLVAFPQEIRAVQRRNSYRVRIPPDAEFSVRCYRIARRAELRDRPLPGQEVLAEARDISLGGLGITFRGQDNEAPKVSQEDRIRLDLRYRDLEVLVEGRMRTPTGKQPPNAICTGVRFVFLQDGIQDRQTLAKLTKIVGELQREESHYRRMAGRDEKVTR